MPAVFPEFPHHSEMGAYLDSYADCFELREQIRFRCTVQELKPDRDGWHVVLNDGTPRRYRAAVVAIGHDWCPKLPNYPGAFNGQSTHSRDYRTPEPFARKRVLLISSSSSSSGAWAELFTGRLHPHTVSLSSILNAA